MATPYSASTLREYVINVEATVVKKEERCDKYEQKRRDAQARLEGMSNAELVFTGLMEAQQIFEQRILF